MSASLTEDGSRVIAQQVDHSQVPVGALDSLSDELQVADTIQLIKEHGFKRVALQLPDELLQHAQALVRAISLGVTEDVRVFVLGDTSFGKCCVDEVAAQHHDADFIVHYGQSCLSDTSRFPVHFVFGRLPLDVVQAVENLAAHLGQYEQAKRVFISSDVRFHYYTQQLADLLESQQKGQFEVHAAKMRELFFDPRAKQMVEGQVGDIQQAMKTRTFFGQTIESVEKDGNDSKYVLVHVGFERAEVTQVALETSGDEQCEALVVLDPVSLEVRRADDSRSAVLTKRFVKVQQAKDASVFGILVGTMGVKGYNKVLEHLSKLISDSGRKSYTFLMGKLNPQKLANFPNIDAFVLVACPLNSLIDSKDFFKPVVTPREVEIALGIREWSLDYSCDFNSLNFDVDSVHALQDDAPHFSSVSGAMVTTRLDYGVGESRLANVNGEDPNQGETSRDLVTSDRERHHITIRYSSPAGDALAEQTFQGLEPSKGDKPAAAAMAGQTGIASELYEIGRKNKDAR